jgi:predicted phosphohydrolase
MRIVAVADTHTFESDLGEVPDGDVFVHAGDMVRAGTLDELEGVAAWISGLPHRYKVIVAGNHDWCFDRERAAAIALFAGGITYLQDQEALIDGVRFWGSPWQPEFNDWAFNLPRGAALADKWALIPDNVDVLITHGPPAGFGDSSGVNGRQGCEDLTRAVRRSKPSLHMFGHIHEDGGVWRDGDTLFANVTTWECERQATVIDYDPSTRSVNPVFVPAAR